VAEVVFDAEADAAACGLAEFDGDGMVTCGAPSVGVLVMACVHEHVETPGICAACAAEIQRAGPGWLCSLCDDGPQAHPCEPFVVIEWDSGEKTVVQAAPAQLEAARGR
jgi:hypothetical protein